MGEYEPNDSRSVTQTQRRAPGEPPRTGPRESETRKRDPRDEDAQQRERAIEQDAEELDAAQRGERGAG